MKIELGLNESGMIVIHDAYAYGEVKEESIASKIKGFFGGSSSSASSTATAEEGEETTTEETPSETPSDPGTVPESTSTPASVPVKFELKHSSIVPYTPAEISAARKRLIAVDNAEKLRHKKEEARNMLEGYLYRMRDLLAGEANAPFMLYSKEEERRKLEDRMTEAFALVNEGDDAELAELWRRREEME
jgi:hypoxia up-regulated 1